MLPGISYVLVILRNMTYTERKEKEEVMHMKRKGWLTAAAVSVLLCILMGVMWFLKPVHADVGFYIAAEEPMVVFRGRYWEPVVMRSSAENRRRFQKLHTGDKILVFHDGRMMLSYPAQLNVYLCIRLRKGDVSDLPEGGSEALEEMGWIQGGSFGKSE